MRDKCLEDMLPNTPTPLICDGIKLTKSFLSSAKPSIITHDQKYEILSHLCANLSLVEQIFVSQKIAATNTIFDEKCFFNSLGYTHIEQINEIKSYLFGYSDSFLIWLSEKKLNIRDFQAFMYDYKKSEHQASLDHLAKLNLSKSLFIKIVDIYFDLLAVKKIEPDYLLKFTHAQPLIKSLEKIRFKNTFSQDEEFEKKLQNIQLNKQIKVKVQREGDSKVLTAELKAKNPYDLKKQATNLLSEIEKINTAWELK